MRDTFLQNPRLLDWLLCACGVIPAFLFGVIVGNLTLGVPFTIWPKEILYEGTFWDFFNPVSLVCGVISMTMMLQQGILGLSLQASKFEHHSELRDWTLWLLHPTTLILLMAFSMIGLYSSVSMDGYVLDPTSDEKKVLMVMGAWGQNYDLHPWMRALPAFGYLGLLSTWFYMIKDDLKMAMISNSVAIAGIVGTAGVSIYPFFLPSSTNLTNSSLTLWDYPASPTVQIWSLVVLLLLSVPLMKILLGFYKRVLCHD